MEDNIEARRAYRRKYEADNKERLAEQRRVASRRRYAEDPEKYKAINKKKYEEFPERYRIASDRWKDENKEELAAKRLAQYKKRKQEARDVSAFIGARNRAKLKGFEFTLTREWLAAQPKVCALSGLPFRPEYDGVHGRNPFAPSIDRIDSAKGYTLDNCRVILSCLNMGLGQWGLDEVLPIWKAVIAQQDKTPCA